MQSTSQTTERSFLNVSRTENKSWQRVVTGVAKEGSREKVLDQIMEFFYAKLFKLFLKVLGGVCTVQASETYRQGSDIFQKIYDSEDVTLSLWRKKKIFFWVKIPD